MKLVVLSAVLSALVVLIGTPILIKFLLRHGYSQAIRVSTDDEPYPEHEGKRGKHDRPPLRSTGAKWIGCTQLIM